MTHDDAACCGRGSLPGGGETPREAGPPGEEPAVENRPGNPDHTHEGEHDARTTGAGSGDTGKRVRPVRRGGSPASGTGSPGVRPGATPAPAPPEVALRGPAELADALPYLLGYQPDDSLVVVVLQGERGRFGSRLRVGIPADSEEWKPLAEQVAAAVGDLGSARTGRPVGAVVYLCRDPAPGHAPEAVVEELRPLAQCLRTECGLREITVHEALCVSDRRVWSYCCPEPASCPDEGRRLAAPGTSVMAAAAVWSGMQIPRSQREMEGRLAPVGPPFGEIQLRVLEKAAAAFVPRMLGEEAEAVGRTVLGTVGRLMDRFRSHPPDPGAGNTQADAHDDDLLRAHEAAVVIIGLQERRTRDRAAEWVEDADTGPALRLWRALARRCVGPFLEHAAAPLTLAGWVAWAGGDEPAARVAFGCALRADPEYVLAQLLHRACNDGLDPELLRHCIRQERAGRQAAAGRKDTAADPPGAAP